MNIFEWQAHQAEETAKILSHWIGTTRQDRLDWSPKADGNHEGRSVLSMATECIRVNRLFASIISGGPPPGEEAEVRSAEEAQARLTASAQELAKALRGADESILDKRFPTPRGMEIPGRFAIRLPINNMLYHGGQVNYIQTLYGDMEFSVPPGILD